MTLCLQDAYRAQAKADFDAMEILREHSTLDCHWLHMLQMSLEKLAKAFRASDGEPYASLSRSHVTARIFLRLLARAPSAPLVWKMNPRQFSAHMAGLIGIATAIEGLAPAVGPESNVEYPWEQVGDQFHVPCQERFPVAREIEATAHGRSLIKLMTLIFDKWDVLV